MRSSEETRNARRSLFLKKVQSGREDERWQARGGEDEIMRMIFVSEQKRWEANLEKAAKRIPTIYEEEEQSETPPAVEEPEFPEEEEVGFPPVSPQFQNGPPTSPDEFEEYLDRDGQELEELLSQMEID